MRERVNLDGVVMVEACLLQLNELAGEFARVSFCTGREGFRLKMVLSAEASPSPHCLTPAFAASPIEGINHLIDLRFQTWRHVMYASSYGTR